MPSSTSCDHAPEPHVVYDRLAAGYRGTLVCPCGAVRSVSPRLRTTHEAAEADAEDMLGGHAGA